LAVIALAYAASAAGAADAGSWKDIPLDSCRKVQGVSENMMGVCLDEKTLYAIGGTLYALDVSEPANPKLLGSID